jgi:polyisoprenoid-binding protein YceI
MKKSPLLLGCLAIAFMFTSCEQPQSSTDESKEKKEKTEAPGFADGSYVVDKQNSRVEWKGTMVGVYSHTGTLSFESGKIGVENGKVTAGEFVVDMNSLVLTDDNYDPEKGNTKEKLVEHLKSDDFFLVSEYPTAHFSLSGVDGDKAKGEMTIRGNTNSVKIENLDIHDHDGELHITGTAVLNRQNYDVKFSHPLEEMVLSNDLEIKINVSAKHNN